MEYNIILLDVEEDKIVKNAAFCLNETKYLSETNQLPSWPANGIIFQANHSRNFIHLICQYDDNPGINVIFCVEPGLKYFKIYKKFKNYKLKFYFLKVQQKHI